MIPIFFGTVDLHPGGDTVRINAASGFSTPHSSRSIVSDGRSGLIRIVSDSVEHVDVLYPGQVTLRNGNRTLYLTEIGGNSEYNSTGVDLIAGIPVDINIGGKINFAGGEIDGQYGGTMVITINFE